MTGQTYPVIFNGAVNMFFTFYIKNINTLTNIIKICHSLTLISDWQKSGLHNIERAIRTLSKCGNGKRHYNQYDRNK